jgi:hypothetical protein
MEEIWASVRTYHQFAWEEGRFVGEALEERLLGGRSAGKLPLGEYREDPGQEAGPDGVGVGGSEERPRDGGRAAGVGRRREGDH